MLFKNLDKWAQQNNITPPPQSSKSKKGRLVKKNQPASNLQQSPPMMYRAQVAGRCNLQFAGDNDNLEQWKKEWVLPQTNNQPSYQYDYQLLDSEHPNNLIHSIKVTFPYRVLSNCGQDSILRPVLTAHGIPFIPGSSVKGIFKRLIKSKPEDSPDRILISDYCGTEEIPGILRFHGAYPIGNWSNQMVDIVHPQQSRQVKNNKPTSAYTLISFYQPEFVFEFSSANFDLDWQNVERILNEALTGGLGGKTSTGYGFLDKPDYAHPDREAYKTALHVSLEGEGVASTLLNRDPEFRPNMFKAVVRGHMTRLLAGVCNSEAAIEENINFLLGSTDKEGAIKLFWESTELIFPPNTTPPTYYTDGILHISADSRADAGDLNFIAKILQFAYIMGGFGKSWRRVWHQEFKRDYKKFAIGCHWQLKSDWIHFNQIPKVNSKDTLESFLEDLHQTCIGRLGSRPPAPVATWREVWHPDNVTVYAIETNSSQAIDIFHDPFFKYTPAIGGRGIKIKDGKEKPDDRPTSVSSVWHRMLPIGDGKYLEIVTIFHGDRIPWQSQLNPFIKTLINKEFQLTWGNRPN